MKSLVTPAPYGGPTHAWYTVAILMLAYTLAYIDRPILTILVEPIQRDLGINGTQVSLLHGVAFVIFYVTLGLPMGYIADRVNRRKLIVASIAAWSLMTAICGTARSFGQLFLARVGVGIGEAGLSPASYSMIADYFPPRRRSIALGVDTIGLYLGGGCAILLGGLIASLAMLAPVSLFGLMPGVPSTVACLAALLFFGAFSLGAAPAALQRITPNRMRGVVSAAYLMAVNIVALAIGPTATGFLTDDVFHSPKSVGLSTSIVGAASTLVAVGMFCLRLKPFREALPAQR